MNHGFGPFAHLARVSLYLTKRSFGQASMGRQCLEALFQMCLSVQVYTVKQKRQYRRHQSEDTRERLTPVMPHQIPLLHKRLLSVPANCG